MVRWISHSRRRVLKSLWEIIRSNADGCIRPKISTNFLVTRLGEIMTDALKGGLTDMINVILGRILQRCFVPHPSPLDSRNIVNAPMMLRKFGRLIVRNVPLFCGPGHDLFGNYPDYVDRADVFPSVVFEPLGAEFTFGVLVSHHDERADARILQPHCRLTGTFFAVAPDQCILEL